MLTVDQLFPHVKYVMDKFRHKLPKEELKRFAKEVSKKLVNSDYKNNRVEDPTSITEKQERKVKNYVKEFFDRAVQKYQEHEKKKASRPKKDDSEALTQPTVNGSSAIVEANADVSNGDAIITDDEGVGATPESSDLKRKRIDDLAESPDMTPSDTPFIKRVKENETDAPSPPPPPPPPPPENENGFDSATPKQVDSSGEQDVALYEQQEDEERQRLREEEAALERENELNMLEFQRGELKTEATSVMSH